MCWTGACCKQKTAMGGCRWCCHEYCLSGDRLRLCEGVCNNTVECLKELLRQCDTSAMKIGRQPHSKVRAVVPTPRTNAELSEGTGRRPCQKPQRTCVARRFAATFKLYGIHWSVYQAVRTIFKKAAATAQLLRTCCLLPGRVLRNYCYRLQLVETTFAAGKPCGISDFV